MSQRFSIPLLFAVLIACQSLLSGCAFLGGGNAPLPKAKGYEIQAPTNWKEEGREESDKAYRLTSGSIVTINSSCTRNTKVPLEVLTKHLLLGLRNVAVEKQELLEVAGEQGMYSQVRATLEGTLIYSHLFVLPKRNCVFDFSLMNRRPISEKDAEAFLSFVKSFKYNN